jgi:SPOR domain
MLEDKLRTDSRRDCIPRRVIEHISSPDIGDEFARFIQQRDLSRGCCETRSAARSTDNNDSLDRDDHAPISPNGRGSIFLQSAADDWDNGEIQAAAISRGYGAGDNHDNLLRWRGGLAFAISLLALTVLGTVGTFGYVFSALPPIVKDGTKLDSAVGNYSDASKSSVTSVGSNEKLASREQQPGITAPGRDPAPAASALDPDVPAPVSTPSSVQVLVQVLEPVSSEPKKIHAVMIGSDGRSATDTTWLPVHPPHSPRRAAARSSTAAPPPSGSHGVHRDTSPSTPSRFHVRAGRRTAREAYAAGSYAVQLASEHSAAAAHASFRALRATFPNQLGGRKPTVRRTDLGAKGIYYRAMVGPFASMQKAAGMCARLKTVGGDCLVQRD